MDFIVTWVDHNDPEWRKEFLQYKRNKEGSTAEARFRDWETLPYWFRGIEQFAPWVDKIHFVTYGHIPDWLNKEHPKLNIVTHKEFIPEKYLPTFNSRTIDLHFHKIKSLNEDYVYFNDDMFLIDHIDPQSFFKNGKPRDMAILNALGGRNDFNYTFLSNTLVLNKHFIKSKSFKEKKTNWLNIKYGKMNVSNLFLLYFKKDYFTGFYNFHLPQPHKKSTLELLWVKEAKKMNEACNKTFRHRNTVNIYLQRLWALASNDFQPINLNKIGQKFEFRDKIPSKAIEFVKKQKKPLICLNDYEGFSDKKFKKAKQEIKNAFEVIVPEKSSFEL